MHTAHTADALIRRYNLSGNMLAAIRSGANGRILSCAVVTEKALVNRGIMHPTESTLTALGRQILDALNAARGAVEPATPAAGETPPRRSSRVSSSPTPASPRAAFRCTPTAPTPVPRSRPWAT
ncbi:hypothetical protein ACFQ3Z_16225 [Streptomyces nogalater]